ncbi:pyridoxamine 5'-phosphate oxidase [Microbacterium limosum]|uniref:Pyridoxine/pyridoxamine 5'-phosphate oxidase n=1 Tax=Microbacterium limosum TaxID=3079935 RepID=A0AAU0MKQ4_9MICO|nr:pyridoxamine 5'-phosphate oxidase [Microbacterium sp. Y20]WOQ70676.1 pyridoxamine 5'-phosphate oxidase [Microbacterium sp. Y20]
MDPLSHRAEYELDALDEADFAPEPLAQLAQWLERASDAGLVEPNAMVISTIDPGEQPSSRTVLLRGIDESGLLFYTNRQSRKGRALAHRAAASALFPWYALQRQVIVAGRVELVDDAASDAYFAARPRASQIAARASHQSEEIGSRAELEAAFAREAARWQHEERVPRPDFWGGYRLVVDEAEFWQGRRSRLHDRIVYRRGAGEQTWELHRLQP